MSVLLQHLFALPPPLCCICLLSPMALTFVGCREMFEPCLDPLLMIFCFSTYPPFFSTYPPGILVGSCSKSSEDGFFTGGFTTLASALGANCSVCSDHLLMENGHDPKRFHVCHTVKVDVRSWPRWIRNCNLCKDLKTLQAF